MNYRVLPPKRLALRVKAGQWLTQICSVSAELFSVALSWSALDNIDKHQNYLSMTLSKKQLYQPVRSRDILVLHLSSLPS